MFLQAQLAKRLLAPIGTRGDRDGARHHFRKSQLWARTKSWWLRGRETSFSCPLPRLVGPVRHRLSGLRLLYAQWTVSNTHISLYDSCLIELRTKTHWTSRLCMNVVWYSWTESCAKTKTIIKTDWQNAFVSLKQHAHYTHMSNKFLCGHQLQLRNHWLQLVQRLAQGNNSDCIAWTLTLIVHSKCKSFTPRAPSNANQRWWDIMELTNEHSIAVC